MNSDNTQLKMLMIALLFPILLYAAWLVTFIIADIISGAALGGAASEPSPQLSASLMVIGDFFLLIALRKFYISRGVSFEKLISLNRVTGLRTLMLVITGASVCFVITFLVSVIPESVLREYAGEESLTALTGPVLTFLWVVIAAPVTEEILFRGLCFHYLKRAMPLIPAIILQAALFGLVHDSLLSMIPAFATGILAALVFEWCGGILAAVIMHAAYNLLACLIHFGVIGLTADAALVPALLGAAAVFINMAIFYKNRPARRKP